MLRAPTKNDLGQNVDSAETEKPALGRLPHFGGSTSSQGHQSFFQLPHGLEVNSQGPGWGWEPGLGVSEHGNIIIMTTIVPGGVPAANRCHQLEVLAKAHQVVIHRFVSS